MKYKLNLCIMYTLGITSLCTGMEKTEIFLRNNYTIDLSYAELPIVALLGSKTIKVRSDALKTNMLTLAKGTQVKLNNELFGLSIATPTSIQSAYYDAGSNMYQGGISDISYILKDIYQNKSNYLHHNTAIITINHSFNPKYLVTNTWNLNITWCLPTVSKTIKIKSQRFLRANPELINIDTDTGASLALVSEMLNIEKSLNSTDTTK